ncbi:MAG: SCO family protein, partial [Kiloniellales bacterium]
LAATGDEVGALFITVDPEHDTPARLADFVARVHPRLVGLTGEVDEIERVQRAYRIGARQRAGTGGFTRLFEHSPIAYLMGPEGDILTLFPPILPPERLAAIVRGYMR